MANPFLDSMNAPIPSNPYEPASSGGLGYNSSKLDAATSTINKLGAASIAGIKAAGPSGKRAGVTPFKPKPQARHQVTGPNVLYSPSQGQMFVNGSTFALDDADAAIRTQGNLDKPRQPAPKGLDWQEVTPEAYAKFIKGITDPGAGRVFSENFGTGVATVQEFAGNLAVLGGAEDFGFKLRDSAAEKQRKNAPFSYEFTGVLDGDTTAADWFVGAIASTTPLIIESLITTVAGAVFGSGIASPGLGTAAGAMAGLVGKTAFKKVVKESVEEYAKQRAISKAAGKAFLKTPKGKVLVRASGIAGMAIANYGNNYAIGTADVYGELLNNGVDPNDMDAKITALTSAVPYAALESIPEFILGAKILGGLSKGSKGGIFKRAGKGAAVGAPAEGFTEFGQNEVVTRAGEKHGHEYGDDEKISRAINSFAAGFAVGGGIGGIANLRSYKPSDLLTGAAKSPPAGDTGTPPPTPKPAAPTPAAPTPAAAAGPDVIILDPIDESATPEPAGKEKLKNPAKTTPKVKKDIAALEKMVKDVKVNRKKRDAAIIANPALTPAQKSKEIMAGVEVDSKYILELEETISRLKGDEEVSQDDSPSASPIPAAFEGVQQAEAPAELVTPVDIDTVAPSVSAPAAPPHQPEAIIGPTPAGKAKLKKGKKKPEPIPEPIPAPVAEPTPEPIVEVTPEPIPAPVEAVKEEPKPEPKPEPAPVEAEPSEEDSAEEIEALKQEMEDIVSESKDSLLELNVNDSIPDAELGKAIAGGISGLNEYMDTLNARMKELDPEFVAGPKITLSSLYDETPAPKEKPKPEPKKPLPNPPQPKNPKDDNNVKALTEDKSDKVATLKEEHKTSDLTPKEKAAEVKELKSVMDGRINDAKDNRDEVKEERKRRANYKGDVLVEVDKYKSIAIHDDKGLVTEAPGTSPDLDGTPAENTAALLKVIKAYVPENTPNSNVVFQEFDNDVFDMDALESALAEADIGLQRPEEDPVGPYTDEIHAWILNQEPKVKKPTPAPVEEAAEPAGKAGLAEAMKALAAAKEKNPQPAGKTKLAKPKATPAPKADPVIEAATTTPTEADIQAVVETASNPALDIEKTKNTMLVEEAIVGFEKARGDPEKQLASLIAIADVGYYEGGNSDKFTAETHQRAKEYMAKIQNVVAAAINSKQLTGAMVDVSDTFKIAMNLLVKGRGELGVEAQKEMLRRVKTHYPELSRVLFDGDEINVGTDNDRAIVDALGIVEGKSAPAGKAKLANVKPANKPREKEKAAPKKAEPPPGKAKLNGPFARSPHMEGVTMGDINRDAELNKNKTRLGPLDQEISDFENTDSEKDPRGLKSKALAAILDIGFFSSVVKITAKAKKARVYLNSIADEKHDINNENMLLLLDMFEAKAIENTSWNPAHMGHHFGQAFGLNEEIEAAVAKKKVQKNKPVKPVSKKPEPTPDPIADFEPDNDKELLDKDLLFDEIEMGESDLLDELGFKRVDNDETIKAPLDRIRLSTLAREFVSKLRKKPTHHIYKDKEELKRRNPTLFDRIQAALPTKDFNNINAVALSIGEEVVIFSDKVYTEQQAKFVLAHETLGHYGLRSILTNEELNIQLDEIYKNDPYVTAAADRNMHFGMDRHEAIEEVIADKAAQLDANIISRLWANMKTALNKIGLKFTDDMARYLINQARRNVYNGGAAYVSPGKLMNDLRSLQNKADTVRFDVVQDTSDAATVAMNSDANNRRSVGLRGIKAILAKSKDIAGMFGSMLENVQSLDNMSTRSDGLQRVFNIFQMRANRARRFLANYENMTAFSHSAFSHTDQNGDSQNGPSKKELLQAGKLLIYGSLNKQSATTDKDIKVMGDLVTADEDVVGVNRANLQGARDAGTITREEFTAGIEITLGDPDTDVTHTENWTPDFEISDRVWDIYTEQRDAVEQSALDVLTSIVEGGIAQKEDALGGFKVFGTRGNKLTDLDLKTIRLMMDQYAALYQKGSYIEGGRYMYNKKSVAKATLFLREVNRALFNADKLDDWKNGRENTALFQGVEYAEIIKGLEVIHDKRLAKKDANKITSTIGNLYLLDVQVTVAQFEAKRTIMRSYAPATRRGDYQILVRAFDDNGEVVKLGEEWGTVLPYYQASSAADAREIAEDINTDFGGRTYSIEDANGDTQTITFRATSGKNRQGSTLGQQFSLSDFVNVLSRLDININPTERERIVTALTRQTDKARRSLQRAGVRGWDEDVVRSVSEYLETQGHIAGQAFYRHKLDNVMLDDSLWRGDYNKLKKLEAEYKRTDITAEERREAELIYDKYVYMYSHMADVGQPEASNRRNGKPLANEGKGEDYRANALRLQQWYSEASNINDSTEDLLSGEVGSKLKLWVVVAQLGGSVATAGVNLLSIATNAIPYLANYNAARGFGGGFGLANTAYEIQRAAFGQANHKLSNAAYLDQVVNNPALQVKHGLSLDEAIFMRDATYEGILQSAQANALIGTARGGIHSNKLQGAIKSWMFMFSYTEQYNRRVTALAAYRLYMKRALAGTPNFEQLSEEEQAALVEQWEVTGSEFARTAVNTSQGEYGMFNRPELARGNVGQYLFIYKQFTIITIQLMKGLDAKGRIQMLMMIFLLAGLKGMPFSEDLMDVFDTLMQKFGVKQASIEASLVAFIEEVAPGWSPILMRGLLDQFTPATVSTRAGFGDILPLTGAGRAGADPYRELSNFLGPVWAGMEGAFIMASNATSYGAQTLGIKDKTMSFGDVFRDTPIAALRGFADALTYHSSGVVTNADGKVLDPSASYGQIAARALGFYPSIATKSNDVIRLSKFKGEYIKALRSRYTTAYVKAYVERDRKGMLEVEALVREWNNDNRNTAYEFKDFRRRAIRAAKAAAMPAAARFLSTAGKNLRPDVIRLMEVFGVDNLENDNAF